MKKQTIKKLAGLLVVSSVAICTTLTPVAALFMFVAVLIAIILPYVLLR